MGFVSSDLLHLFNVTVLALQEVLTDQLACIQHFTSALVMTSHQINACAVFASCAYLRNAHVSVAARMRDYLNAKDVDMV